MCLGTKYFLKVLKTYINDWMKILTVYTAKFEFRKLPYYRQMKYTNLKLSYINTMKT